MKKNNIFTIAIIIFIIIISFLIIMNLTTKKEGQLIKLTSEQVREKVENKEDFVLVVSQSTCSHCATYKPKVEIVAKEQGLNMYYIDFDKEKDSNEFLKEFNLSGTTPTTIFIKDGKETSLMDRLEGDLGTSAIIKKLQKLGFIEK